MVLDDFNDILLSSTTTSSYRILISFMLLSGVVLSNSYAGGLSVLTIPRYEKSLETIHDFAQSPYRWGDPAIAWILSLVDAETVKIT